MLMLIWNNIARRRTQSVLTVTITMLTVFVFVMVLGVFQTVNQGLALSEEHLGADAVLDTFDENLYIYGNESIPCPELAQRKDLIKKLDKMLRECEKASAITAASPCSATQAPIAKGRMKPEVIGPLATPPESKAMAVYTGGTNRLSASAIK